MYKYSITSENSEYSQFELIVEHDTKFTEKEFKSVCEEVFSYAITEEQKGKKYVSVLVDSELVLKYLENKGFKRVVNEITEYYFYHPFSIENNDYYSENFQKFILENDKRNKENF